MFTQVAANVLLSASIFLLVAMGFGIQYSVLRFFPFSFAASLTVAPYTAFILSRHWHVPWSVSVPAAIGIATLLALAVHECVVAPLRRRAAPPLLQFLGALGTYIVVENLIGLSFGADSKRLLPIVAIPIVEVSSARLTLVQAGIVVVSLAMATGFAATLSCTHWGLTLRAVADDPELSDILGISSDRVTRLSVAASGALAGVAGLLLALDVNLRPSLGLHVLFAGVVTAVLGGALSPIRQILAAVLLATGQHLGGLVLGTAWQDATLFVIFFVAILLRHRVLI